MSSPATCPNCAQPFESRDPASGAELDCPHCAGGIHDRLTWDNVASTPTAGRGAPGLRFLAKPQNASELGSIGNYSVVKLLGKGGMGMVFEAVDTQLRRPVALKVMNPQLGRDAGFRERFMREARAMAAVHSDNIVTIHQVGEQNGVLFLAMELLRGEALDRRIKDRRPFTTSEVLRIGAGIARALAAVHANGHIHRDIKPANIWLEEPGGRVKVLDFGITLPTGGEHLTSTGSVMGTPGYMAPEHAEGSEVDQRCDLFSLGCVLHELVTGKPTFTGTSAFAILKAVATQVPPPLDQVKPDTPPALCNVVAALLEKDPAKRPASAQEIAETLDALRAELEGEEVPRDSASRLIRWKRSGKKRMAMLAAAAAAVVLILGAVFGGSMLRKTQHVAASSVVKIPSTAQGVTDSEIVLGMSAAFSGPTRELGRGMRTGILAFIEAVNDRGGIGGRKLRLIALDDGYDPERALANMKELDQRHKVFAFIGNVGTPTAEVTMPFASGRKMLFFGAFSGAAVLRDVPPNRYVFNYRAGYVEETESIVRYLTDVRQLEPAQIAVFAQEDAYGQSGFEGVARALRHKGWPKEKIVRVGYKRNTADVDAAVNTILNHPELRAVVMVPTYRPAARFIQKIRDAGRTDLVLANVSFVDSRALAEELMERGPQYVDGVIVTQVVPLPGAGSSIALQCAEAIRKYQPSEQVSFTSLEGYIAAAVFVEALKKVEGNLSTETLVTALESMQNFDLGLGTRLSFGPSDHQASDKVWGTVLDRNGEPRILRDMDD
jgi:ABC-type branched-subunit amino acid transport system substrate-binding protein